MNIFLKGKCRLLLSTCFSVSVFSLAAQQHTLQDLINSTNTHLPSLQQKQALVNAAHATVTDVQHSYLPQLRASEQLNIGSDNSMAGSYFPFGITPSTSAGVRNENSLQPATGNMAVVYGEYELYNFGLKKARIGNAETMVDLQKADYEREQYMAHAEVVKLYFNLLKNKYLLAADKQNVSRYDSIFHLIRALTASGIKPGSDSSLAKAELSKTKITYTQTMGTINQLKEQLSFFTGIASRELNIDTLPALFSPSLYAADAPADTVNNPLIDFYSKRKEALLSNETVIKKSFMPKVMLASSVWARGSSIQFSDQYKSLTNGLGYQRFNYAVGLAFTYNLFNGLYKKDKLTINRYQTDAATAELEQQKAALQAATMQAENVLQVTRDNLEELNIQLQSAQDTYRQKIAQYKAGIISLIDLTNASFVLYRSQIDYINTINSWWLSQLDKATANGTLTQFIQTIK